MQKKSTIEALLASIAACAAVLTAVPGVAQNAKPPAGMPVKVAQVRTGTVTTEVSAVGTLLANESVMIRPEIAGRVAAIHFSEGQPVSGGAKLVTLDQAELAAQLAGSSADARLNSERAKRAEELYRKNFISQQALDEAREALKKSTARKAEDEARLAKTEIRAPFSGVLGLRLVSVGAYLRAGEDIVRLDNIGSMKVDFRVPEVYLARVRKDQPITLRVDAYPDEQFAGRVYAIETTLDEKTRTALLRARAPNSGRRLKPGMFARIALTLGSHSNAILVPEQAVVPRGDKVFIFRVAEGKAQLTEVQLGSRTPGEAEVVKGLKAGDVVVTEGHQKLRDGTPVMVLADKPAAGVAK